MDITDARITQIGITGKRQRFVVAADSSPLTAEPAMQTVPLDGLARRVSHLIYGTFGQCELDQPFDRCLQLDPRAQGREISGVLDMLNDGRFFRYVADQAP